MQLRVQEKWHNKLDLVYMVVQQRGCDDVSIFGHDTIQAYTVSFSHLRIKDILFKFDVMILCELVLFLGKYYRYKKIIQSNSTN